jgi:transaldolase
MPQGTLNAVKEHGAARGDALTPNIESAIADLTALAATGVSLQDVGIKLELEGIDKFVAPWIELIETVTKVASN